MKDLRGELRASNNTGLEARHSSDAIYRARRTHGAGKQQVVERSRRLSGSPAPIPTAGSPSKAGPRRAMLESLSTGTAQRRGMRLFGTIVSYLDAGRILSPRQPTTPVGRATLPNRTRSGR